VCHSRLPRHKLAANISGTGGLTIGPAAADAPPSRPQPVAQVERRAAGLPPLSRARGIAATKVKGPGFLLIVQSGSPARAKPRVPYVSAAEFGIVPARMLMS
jgi:hypothetical protein